MINIYQKRNNQQDKSASGISYQIADFLNLSEFAKLTYQQKVGYFGQVLAKKYLMDKGYEVLAENYYVGGGEIDLVMRKQGKIASIEVKTRTSKYFGDPHEAVHPYKLKRLYLATQKYMKAKDWLGTVAYTIDAVSVFVDKNNKKIKICHYKNIQPKDGFGPN